MQNFSTCAIINSTALWLMAMLFFTGAIEAATFTVTTTADSGAGSLRQAIMDANATVAVPDTIEFNIPPTDGRHVYYREDGQNGLPGDNNVTVTTESDDANLDNPDQLYPLSWYRIRPMSPLPAITDPIFIDGYSQPNSSMATGEVGEAFNGTLRIELYGPDAGSNNNGLFLDAGSDGSTIRGLAIQEFRGTDQAPSNGIFIASNNNRIEGNIIGSGVDGLTSSLNRHGIQITGASNTVGGLSSETRNIISGNSKAGVVINGGSGSNFIRRNFIGLNRTGVATLGNFQEGVAVVNSPNNVIGGGNPIARNFLSGNGFHGILLFGPMCTGNFVRGNYIGTDITGTQDIGNAFHGIVCVQDTGNTIGGLNNSSGNLCSGNGQGGITLDQTTNCAIQGNTLGTDPAGDIDLGNGFSGVLLVDSSDNLIDSNTAAFNERDGILIAGNSVNNRTSQNSTYSNAFLGIDLATVLAPNAFGDGVTANDPGDPDTGPNNHQNFPVISNVSLNGTLDFTYSVDALNTNAAYPLTTEFFIADIDGEEGLTYIGFDMYADGAGEKVASITPASTVNPGDRIVATVTDSNGNTSEFSANVLVGGETVKNVFTVNSTGDDPDINTADGVCDTGNMVGGEPECTLCAAIQQANAIANANGSTPDEILFDIPAEDPNHLYYLDDGIPDSVTQTIGITTAIDDGSISGIDPDWPNSWYSIAPDKTLPEITDPVVIDAYSQNGASVNINGVGQGLTTILRIELNGNNAGRNFEGMLNPTAGGCIIKGLAINRVDGPPIRLADAGGNLVEGCFLGPDISGLALFQPPSGGAVITDRSGVFVISPNNTIGGTAPAAKNLISGNTRLGGNGIGLGDFAFGPMATGNQVQGNFIGTDRTGARRLENRDTGVGIDHASANTIGGASPQAGNVISGNTFFGTTVSSRSFANAGEIATSNVIQNNIIGADVTGTQPVPNDHGGVSIENATGNIVSKNIIAFNDDAGVVIEEDIGLRTSGNLVTMNSIFSNSSLGIDLKGSAGKGLADTFSVVNFPQDEGDADTGANNFQNFPVLTGVASNGNSITVTGTLNSFPNSNYRLEFFTNEEADDSNFGEGKTYLGSEEVSTDAVGNAIFSVDLQLLSQDLQFITATATDITDRGSGPANDTSEFSSSIAFGECELIVTNAEDSGPGSFREAVKCANAIPGMDTITFNIPGAGPHKIPVLSALPTVLDPVIIDGFTQGEGTPGDPSDDALPNTNPVGEGLNTVIKIHLDGAATQFIFEGLRLFRGASGSLIRGLAIGDQNYGLILEGCTDVRIEGNFIGLDSSGTVDAGHSEDGVYVLNASKNIIGGLTPDKRNLISENRSNGIFIEGASSTENLIQGNLIGTDITGTLDYGNSDDGVDICDGPSNNTVGGTDPNSRNLIAANGDDGLDLELAHDNTVQGNWFGVTVDGSQPLGHGENEEDGDCIDVCEAWNNRIIGNILVGGINTLSDGIQITGASATGNVVQSNYIGTDRVGATNLGNMCEGIFIGDGASNNLIGGITPGDGNVIAHNQTNAGVHIDDATSIGNAVLGNSIFSNAALGIDLGEGVSPNDNAPDSDEGPNNLQNFPVLTSLSSTPNDTTFNGTLSSLPTTMFRIEFFANSACDISGNGEGERFLGADTVTTDGAGMAVINSVLSQTVSTGEFITSTATVMLDPSTFGDTSEFSQCLEVTEGQEPTPTPTPGPMIECDHLDFDGNQVVDSRDLLQLLTGIDNGDLVFDLTQDGMLDEDDVFRFSQCWYVMTGR